MWSEVVAVLFCSVATFEADVCVETLSNYGVKCLSRAEAAKHLFLLRGLDL